jgi:hypothetical protein
MSAIYKYLKHTLKGRRDFRADVLSPEAICYKSLLKNFTYRIEPNQNGVRTLLSFYKRVVFQIFKKKTRFEINYNLNTLVFDGSPESKEIRVKYLENTEYHSNNYINREEIISGLPSYKRVSLLTISSFLFALLFFARLLGKKSSNHSLLMLELPEYYALCYQIKKINPSKLLFYCAYEIDANIIALSLPKKLEIIKIPSSNPLQNFYKEVVSDTFILTAPFQKAQYEELKKNWFVKKIKNGPMEFYRDAQKVIEGDTDSDNKKYPIAFLSSGNWLREELNMPEFGIGERQAELDALEFVHEYCTNHRFSLLILLHPLEKKPIYKDKVSSFYNQYEDIIIGDLDKNSYDYFNKIEICISTYSSAGFVRLGAGQKMIFTPLSMINNYKGTEIDNISVSSKEQLFDKIEEVQSLDQDNYFSNFQLNSYKDSLVEK